MRGRNTNDAKRRRVAAAEGEAYNKTARALLEKKGFDLDDVNKICDITGYGSVTPMLYFCRWGKIKMCRYLLSRGADCRKRDRHRFFPMFWAAIKGHLEICMWLLHHGGAQEDIRIVTGNGDTPLRAAFDNGHYHVVYWLILNGALAPLRDDVDGGGIDDAIMRRDLRQQFREEGGDEWQDDKRLPILLWAQDAVATYDNVVQLLVTGTIVRSNNEESSLLVTFKGTSGILELIARFVAGTQQQLRTRRQVLDHLSNFIDDTPFVEVDDWNDGAEDDWDDDSDDDSDDELLIM